MIAHNVPPKHRRTAATLTEVLMALLVMGIGLTSVMYIFPLSLLRAIEATKLTNATLLRMNAEARIKSSISYDPANPARTIPYGIVQDPDHNGNVWEHDGTKFVFDPLGMAVLASEGSPLAGVFGWQDQNGNGQYDGVAEAAPIERFAFGMNSMPTPPSFIQRAREFVTLPDSFVTLADLPGATFVGVGNNLTVTAEAGLGEYVGARPRVTILHASEPKSFVAVATIDSATELTLDFPIPGEYAGNIGRIIIEQPEQRYTWIATVRRFGIKPSVTIVVFFRRAIAPEDERIFVCGEPAGSYNEFYYIPSENSGLAKPPGLVVGGWMFDANNFRWWKISSLREGVSIITPTGARTGIRFNVSPEEFDPSAEIRGLGAPKGPVYAMFPRNVVEAYTLKKD